jgi:hypothetical protein
MSKIPGKVNDTRLDSKNYSEPKIDGQSIDAFAKGLETNLTMLLHKLKTKCP